jgi:predicted O-methyltransferase YrrM
MHPNEFKAEVKKVADAGGKVFVEIGSWLGKSARIIASTIPDDAKVYCVDTWKGTKDEPIHRKDPRLPYIYDIFLSNIKLAGLAHKVIPVRMSSLEAAKVFNKKIDFLYVDADHTYEAAYEDVMNWYPKLSKNGVLCGDDWSWEKVKCAVVDAAAVLNITVDAVPNTYKFWKMNRNENYQSTLLEPFKSAKILPFYDSGTPSFSNELQAEAKKIDDAGGKVFVEIGSRLGSSTKLIASSLHSEAKVYAIDTWKGFKGKDGVYETFLSNCIIKSFAHKIIPLKLTLDEAVNVVPENIDFLFFNVAQDTIYKHIINWYPKLSNNSIICGNQWTRKNIKTLIMDDAAALNVSVDLVPNTSNFWKINRIL